MYDEKNQGGCGCGSCSPEAVTRGLKSVIMVLVIVAGVLLIRNWYKTYDYIGKGDIRDTISISGEGKVTALPDIATFTVGVQTEKVAVAAAQTENNDKMNKIIAAIKGMGVKAEDIQTTDYNIYPQYDYLDGRQSLRGYQVIQSVLVKVRDMGKVGDIFAKAGELGANNVGGLSFTIDEPEQYRQEARLKALENAKSKAEALAKAAGIKLGKVVSFSESSGGYTPPYAYDKSLSSVGMGGGGIVAPEIQAGNQEIVIDVVVSYESL
ncbi:MAG: SIMPL domain-containing protein [Patescibacteria group bacterium]|jgi:hypothetical protein